MDPSRLIPTPDTIPVHYSWFYILLILTFVLHLLFMNAMLGSGIIALVNHLRRPSSENTVSPSLAKNLTFIIAFTVNLGVAPLLFLQVLYGHFFYVSSILMAVYWLSVIALLIIAYYSAYIYKLKYDKLGRLGLIFIGLTVIILLVIAFFYTNNLTLMLQPDKWNAYFQNPGGTILNLNDSTLFPRYLHFVTASIAIGGLFLALLGYLGSAKGKQKAGEQIAMGLQWFSYATLVQIMIGLWFLISLPSKTMMLFMGGNMLHTIVFLVGISGAILSLVFGFKKQLWPATASVIGTIVFMVIMRDLVRKAYLDPYFSLSSLKLAPQYSPLFLFLFCFIIGLIIVGFMLKAAAQAGNEV